MSFARRFINLRFELGQGNFGESGSDAVEITGLRVQANIDRPGGVALSTLNMRVYGMTKSQMNQLSTLGQVYPDVRQNKVIVTAGDDVNGKAVVFSGIISEAYLDMKGAPDGAFQVQGFPGLLDALRPLPPSSFKGSADAATIMAGLAQQMSRGFENSGVQVTLSNPYYAGTGKQQADACAREGNFNHYFDDVLNVLAIWPKGQARGGEQILISKATGMIGYPAYMQSAIKVDTEFNSSLTFGAQVTVESDLLPAQSRKWVINNLSPDLESETNGGAWYSHFQALVWDSAP